MSAAESRVPLNRVVAIRIILPDGTKELGSGYLLDATTVLTAKHCTGDRQNPDRLARSITVQRASDGQPVGEVRSVIRDTELDVAVLTLLTHTDEPIRRVSYGRVDRTHSGTLRDCTALGFPWFQRSELGVRGLAEVHGSIYRTPGHESGRMELRGELIQFGADPSSADTRDQRRWAGLSGAAVFFEDRLLGVVLEHHERQGPHVVQLITIERIAERGSPQVREALGLADISGVLLVASTPGEVGITDLAQESELTERVVALAEPMRLNILFAVSSTIGPNTLSAESGALIDTVNRAFVTSAVGRNLRVRLLERQDSQAACPIDASGHRGTAVPLPADSDLDLVIVIVGHDLGEPRAAYDRPGPLADLIVRIQNLQLDGLPAPRLIVLRQRDVQFRGTPTEIVEASGRCQAADAFFEPLPAGQYLSFYRGSSDQPTASLSFSTMLESGLRITVSWLLDQAERIDAIRAGRSDLGPASNPYLGLRAYQAADSASFYGRSDETSNLVSLLAELMETTQLLVVVGASGSGKSSLVRAGLLPRLAIDGISGSSGWVYRTMIFSELRGTPRERLLDSLTDPTPRRSVPAQAPSRDDSLELRESVDVLVAGRVADARVVLFIDQFEELITTLYSEDAQTDGIRLLEAMLRTPRLSLVLTVRSEFFHRLLSEELTPALRTAFWKSHYWLLPPSSRALLAMITRPAIFSGTRFEDMYLPLDILADAGTSVGALPLASCTMQKLHQESANGLLTRKAYEDLGGVRGIVENLGTQAWDKVSKDFPASEVESGLQLVFRSLVEVDETGTAVKRPADRKAFARSPAASALVDALIDCRLAHSDDADPSVPGGGWISLAHEAVLDHWTILADWIREARQALLLLHQVRIQALDWGQRRAAATSDVQRRLIDVQMLWLQERLDTVAEAAELIGAEAPEWVGRTGAEREAIRAFIRPEFDRLVVELEEDLDQDRRAVIGDRIAALGDHRAGVALRADGVPDIAWCSVPTGKVTLRDGSMSLGKFDVPAFMMARYPVTIAQFNAFADPEVYFQVRWWEGLAVWPDAHRLGRANSVVPNHPADHVSWYQAMAFCNWLSYRLGYRVRLPTEWEWVQAAVGDHPDDDFPWGGSWRSENANHHAELHRLVSVGLYPAGNSRCGVSDLSGNCYEWCLNEFDDLGVLDRGSSKPHPTRGGSYFAMPFGIWPQDQLSVRHRLRDDPAGTNDRGQRLAVGIRLVCDDDPQTPPPPSLLSVGQPLG